MLALVVPAVYGLTSLALSALVCAALALRVGRRPLTANDLLAVRLVPAGGAALVTLTVALPAFLVCEPRAEPEGVGPVLLALVVVAVAIVGDGARRTWRAQATARAFTRACTAATRGAARHERRFEIIDTPEPIAAVVGWVRPRIVAARCVLDACSAEEFDAVLAHESAHVAARDNLKLLLLVATPDVLAWSPLGDLLLSRWRAAAEREADDGATGGDPRRRASLASALVKVARMSAQRGARLPALAMEVAADDVGGRVRRLLSGPAAPRPTVTLRRMGFATLLLPLLAVPLYASIHGIIEALVALGR